jgi:hypothetical protein
MTEVVLTSLKSLEKWIRENGFSGYDPYDIKGHPLILRLSRSGNNNYVAMVVREIMYELFYMFPLRSRQLFRIKQAVNAKAMGLFAASYLDLYSIRQDDRYRNLVH